MTEFDLNVKFDRVLLVIEVVIGNQNENNFQEADRCS